MSKDATFSVAHNTPLDDDALRSFLVELNTGLPDADLVVLVTHGPARTGQMVMYVSDVLVDIEALTLVAELLDPVLEAHILTNDGSVQSQRGTRMA